MCQSCTLQCAIYAPCNVTPLMFDAETGSQYRSGIYWHDDEQKDKTLKRVAEINEKLARGEQVCGSGSM